MSEVIELPQESADNPTQFCADCGAGNFGSKFCEECGAPAPAAPPTAVAAPPTAFAPMPPPPAGMSAAEVLGVQSAAIAATTARALRIAFVLYVLAITVPTFAVLILSVAGIWYNAQWLGPVFNGLLALGFASALVVAAASAGSRPVGSRVGAIALALSSGAVLLLSGFAQFGVASIAAPLTAYVAFLSWALIAGFRGWGYLGLLVLLGSDIVIWILSAVVTAITYSTNLFGVSVAAALLLLALSVGALVLAVRLALLWEQRHAARAPVVRSPYAAVSSSPVHAGPHPGAGLVAYPPVYYADRTNGLAVAAMILGILSFTVIPIILGHVALSQIARSGERGRGMAIAGVVLGWVWIALVLVIYLVFFVWVGSYA